MRRHFLIIHNKLAGPLKAPMLKKVRHELEKRGTQLHFRDAGSIEEDITIAREAAEAGGFDAVVATGGDSTIRGVAMGLLGSDMPMGIIPAGTGNVLAAEIGLTRRPAAIVDTLMTGEAKSITLGLANDEPFLLMAGAGFDAEVVHHLNHNLKQRIYKAAYAWPVMRALSMKPPQLKVRFEDEEHNSYMASWVVVTKARYYGGKFIISADAQLTSDEFQVVMFMDMSRLGQIRALLGLARGNNAHEKKKALNERGACVGSIMKTRGVMIRTCQKVHISCAIPAPVQVDGEWIGTTPLQVSSAGGRINLIVPRSLSRRERYQ